MELNLFILREDLADICVASHLHGSPGEFPCSHPLPYVPGMTFFVTPVYVARAEDLPAEPPSGIALNLICAGRPPAPYLCAPHNVLVLADDAPVVVAHDRVMACFARYNAWQHELERIVEAGLPPRRLGRVLAPVFDNPVNLWTAGFRTVFHITDVIDEADNVMGDDLDILQKSYGVFNDGDYLDEEALRDFAADKAFADAASASLPQMYEGEGGKYSCRSLVWSVRSGGGKVAGYFIVDEVNHRIGERDAALAVVVMPYLRRALAADSGQEGADVLDELLSQLLRGATVKREPLAEMLARGGWDRHDKYVVFAMMPLGGADWTSANLRALESCAARCAHNARTVAVGEWVALVANLTRGTADSSEHLDAMVGDVAARVAEVGRSEPFDDIAHVRWFFEQARVAVELAGTPTDAGRVVATEGRQGIVHRYADHYVDDMVRRCRGDRTLDALMPEGLRRLVRADERDGTKLVDMLALYLEHNLNAVETAKAAYVHRNTCANRLRRIREITGIDLDDPDVVFGLRLALRIMHVAQIRS